MIFFKKNPARAPLWPEKTNIGLCRGALITLVLSILFPSLEVAAVDIFNMGFTVEGQREMAITLGLNIIKSIIIVVTLRRWGKVCIRTLLCARLPSYSESLKWGLAGLLMGILSFLRMVHYEYSFAAAGAVSFFTMSYVADSMLAPFFEEIKYRGIFYVALRNRGRLLAYMGSAALFLILHSPSYSDLFLHGILGLSAIQIISLLIFALVSAYIYESTGKLLLCILFHAMANTMLHIGLLVGNL